MTPLPPKPPTPRYTKGSSPKGRNVFLKNMEPFMKWWGPAGWNHACVAAALAWARVGKGEAALQALPNGDRPALHGMNLCCGVNSCA